MMAGALLFVFLILCWRLINFINHSYGRCYYDDNLWFGATFYYRRSYSLYKFSKEGIILLIPGKDPSDLLRN